MATKIKGSRLLLSPRHTPTVAISQSAWQLKSTGQAISFATSHHQCGISTSMMISRHHDNVVRITLGWGIVIRLSPRLPGIISNLHSNQVIFSWTIHSSWTTLLAAVVAILSPPTSPARHQPSISMNLLHSLPVIIIISIVMLAVELCFPSSHCCNCTHTNPPSESVSTSYQLTRGNKSTPHLPNKKNVSDLPTNKPKTNPKKQVKRSHKIKYQVCMYQGTYLHSIILWYVFIRPIKNACWWFNRTAKEEADSLQQGRKIPLPTPI